MKDLSRWFVAAGAVVVCVGGPHGLQAQLVPYNVKYNSGQNVQPIFEGWIGKPDGSFTMHFGYLNRNYVEELYVPVGLSNQIEPGGTDRGQPTYFYTRINRYAFSVTVPKDWDKSRDLVWTLTSNGKTDKAYGSLHSDWEVDARIQRGNTFGTGIGGPESHNRPPVLRFNTVPALTTSSTAMLTALVNDDGLPKDQVTRRRPATGQETPPTLQNMPEAPVNLPQLQREGTQRGRPSRPPDGLSVSWIVWRGPAGALFDPQRFAPVRGGRALTAVTFVKPGDYVLRAIATDGLAVVSQDVKVTVTGQSVSHQR